MHLKCGQMTHRVAFRNRVEETVISMTTFHRKELDTLNNIDKVKSKKECLRQGSRYKSLYMSSFSETT